MAVLPSESGDQPESEDLTKFRQEWLQELRKRKDAPTLDAGTSAPLFPRNLANEAESRSLVKELRNSPDHPLVRNGEIGGDEDMPSSLKKALDIYRRAVSHEQTGKLDEALLLYRQAFRMVRPNGQV
jgi:F-box protein 9